MQKKTSDLLKELTAENADISEYIASNPDSFINGNIKDYWEGIIDKSGLTKSSIINKSDFSYCYFYDIINGRKIPGKDKVVRLILAMKLSLDDCQDALRISSKSALYPKIKRDSILIFALNNSPSIYETNDLLTKHGEEQFK
jgi:hypothetical protein